MVALQKALALLTEKYGELDNIKFCLGNTEGMSPENVEVEILRLAEGIQSGEFSPQAKFPEDRLKETVINT